MERAHTNRPQGPPNWCAFKDIIDNREAWVAEIDDTTQTHCYWLIDHLAAVIAGRDTLGLRQRDEWNHPTTVKRNYERTHDQGARADRRGVARRRPSPLAEARAPSCGRPRRSTG